MVDLIKALQKAHAAEYGAFLAYEGHWKSFKRRSPRSKAWKKIKVMQTDELNHRQAVGFMLIELHSTPNPLLEIFFTLVGLTISVLCYILPKSACNVGAEFIEIMGKNEYRKMSFLALRYGKKEMALELAKMSDKEAEHEKILLGL